tara:strand:+ start:417 stop:698 length:282 start_codon:yes stop_codon:yes gene_type:complete
MPQDIINTVKKYILEGYIDIPVSQKLGHSLDEICLINFHMKEFYEYIDRRVEEDRTMLYNNGRKSYYPEYIGNEYKFIIDGYFNNIVSVTSTN